jgi:hypothetical protein
MFSDILFRLRLLFRRSAVDSELDDELRFHIEQQVEKHVRTGMTREEAERQTRLQFGGLSQVKEDCRESRGVTFVERERASAGWWPLRATSSPYASHDLPHLVFKPSHRKAAHRQQKMMEDLIVVVMEASTAV